MINDLLIKTYVKVNSLVRRKKGQAMVEYTLLIALVAVALIAILTLLNGSIKASIQKIIDALK